MFTTSHQLTIKPNQAHLGTAFCFVIFLLVQSVSAFYNYISDCDEVFNYWEPTHFLQYGRGLQTWEYRCSLVILHDSHKYSPEYALRSYAYLYPQVLIGKLAESLGLSKVQPIAYYR